jgi:hypothetical protein
MNRNGKVLPMKRTGKGSTPQEGHAAGAAGAGDERGRRRRAGRCNFMEETLEEGGRLDWPSEEALWRGC